MEIALLNSSILTSEGTFSFRKISLNDFYNLCENNNLKSFIGHQSNVDVLNTLLKNVNKSIEMNREMYFQNDGEKSIFLKMNYRLK